MKTVLIGRGRLATNLQRALLKSGHKADERKPQNEDKLKWENVHVDKF